MMTCFFLDEGTMCHASLQCNKLHRRYKLMEKEELKSFRTILFNLKKGTPYFVQTIRPQTTFHIHSSISGCITISCTTTAL